VSRSAQISTFALIFALCCSGMAVRCEQAGAKSRGEASRWCVKPGRVDVGCRKDGDVAFSAIGAAGELGPETTVKTESGGLAQIAFKRQALCQFGPVPTEVVTRYGGASRLFLQRTGYAVCAMAQLSHEELPFFCEENVKCPVVVTTNGSFSLRTTQDSAIASSAAYTEQVSSSESKVSSGDSSEMEERSAELIICSGSYLIRVERENSKAVASGSSSQLMQIRIVLIEGPGGVSLSVEDVAPTPTCRGPVVRGHTDELNL
jgi:hypothetical protein